MYKILEDLRIAVTKDSERRDSLRRRMKGSAVSWIWSRWQLFLGHIAVILVVLFLLFCVDGRQFFLSHRLSLPQADGSTIPKLVFLPVQSDITTITSILASAARLASTLWVVGIDLRCVFLSMERGGVTFEGLKSMIGGSIPGYRQFRQKKNYIIFTILQIAILASAFTSSVVSGSVTWKPARKYLPGYIITIPLGRTGDSIFATSSSTLLDSLIGYSTTIYSTFYDTSISTSMHRLVPDRFRSLPIGSIFGELTVPYFAVDRFEWIEDPNSSLSPSLLESLLFLNATGPRVLTIRRWGLIPDGNWGPSESAFPEPLTISESRIFVMSGRPNTSDSSRCNLGTLSSTIPSKVQPYMALFKNVSSCFIFANVTYRAGAARCPRCQLWGPKVIRDIGDVRDLQLIKDPVTSAALATAPYVITSIWEIGYALPIGPAFPTMQNVSIELLSRSYQVAWNALIMNYGLSKSESVNVLIAVDAPRASVVMWRVALWSILHAILVALGFMFRRIHTSGQLPWIEDPVIAALLVDPTPIMSDKSIWAGEDAPLMAAQLKLHERDDKKYIILKRAKVVEDDPEEEE